MMTHEPVCMARDVPVSKRKHKASYKQVRIMKDSVSLVPAVILELAFASLLFFWFHHEAYEECSDKMHTHAPSWIMLSSKAAANISFSALIPAIVFTSLAIIIVLLRWYSRAFLSRRIRIEDYFLLVALILSMAMTGVIGGEFDLDTGNTVHEIRVSLIPTMMKLVYAHSIFYYLSVNLIKISIVLQYIDIFSSMAWIRCACCFLLGSIVSSMLWGVLGVAFMCHPVQKYWKPDVPGHCLNPQQHFWSSAIIGIILDWAIWLMPIPVIGRLKLPRKQKAGLLIVFGLGGFVCVVSILRLVLVHDAAEQGNMTKSGTYALIWSTIEVNVAIICASFLVMKPLFARLFPFMMHEPQMTAVEHNRAIKWLGNRAMLDKVQNGRVDSTMRSDGGMRWGSQRRDLEPGSLLVSIDMPQSVYSSETVVNE